MCRCSCSRGILSYEPCSPQLLTWTLLYCHARFQSTVLYNTATVHFTLKTQNCLTKNRDLHKTRKAVTVMLGTTIMTMTKLVRCAMLHAGARSGYIMVMRTVVVTMFMLTMMKVLRLMEKMMATMMLLLMMMMMMMMVGTCSIDVHGQHRHPHAIL